jgi:hypothetical protein
MLLPVAKYLIVAKSLRFGETAALKRVFFFSFLMQGYTLVNNLLNVCLFILK